MTAVPGPVWSFFRLRSSSAKRMGNLVSKSSRGGIVFVYRQIGSGGVGNPAQVRQGIDPANPDTLS
jgi:hypothetical protein